MFAVRAYDFVARFGAIILFSPQENETTSSKIDKFWQFGLE
jgi:hypothetical protein